MFCRCARALWTTDLVFSDTTEKESFLPSARPSAQPDLPVPPSPLCWWNVCTSMQHLCQHLLLSKGLISFFFIFIADELSWSSGEELNIHTLPPSRGGEEEEVTGEGSLTPVSNWEIWITLVKLHRYKHPLSWNIFFILCLIFSFQSDSTKSNSNYHFSTFLKFVF